MLAVLFGTQKGREAIAQCQCYYPLILGVSCRSGTEKKDLQMKRTGLQFVSNRKDRPCAMESGSTVVLFLE